MKKQPFPVTAQLALNELRSNCEELITIDKTKYKLLNESLDRIESFISISGPDTEYDAEFSIWVPVDFLNGDRPERLLAS